MLQELRLAKQREQVQQQQQQVMPTPSPRTPHSTDELLPSVEEGKEAFYNEVSERGDYRKLDATLCVANATRIMIARQNLCLRFSTVSTFNVSNETLLVKFSLKI